jgi:hypothetical protein
MSEAVSSTITEDKRRRGLIAVLCARSLMVELLRVI